MRNSVLEGLRVRSLADIQEELGNELQSSLEVGYLILESKLRGLKKKKRVNATVYRK